MANPDWLTDKNGGRYTPYLMLMQARHPVVSSVAGRAATPCSRVYALRDLCEDWLVEHGEADRVLAITTLGVNGDFVQIDEYFAEDVDLVDTASGLSWRRVRTGAKQGVVRYFMFFKPSDYKLRYWEQQVILFNKFSNVMERKRWYMWHPALPRVIGEGQTPGWPNVIA